MKAGVNGVLNCSILDGWWAEGYGPEVGWAIGSGEEYQDEELQDRIESEALYDLLEHEIVPLFYQRGRDGLPREWIKRMKASMKSVGQRFSTHRMLKEYSERFYFPALDFGRRLVAEKLEPAKELAAYLEKARKAWPAVSVSELRSDAKPIMERGDSIIVSALVDLGGLETSEAAVELYHGPVTIQDGITDATRDEMTAVERKGKAWEYRVTIVCDRTGQRGYSVRVLPKHPALASPYIPGLIRWA
jgi:starch phosphorylase